MAPQPLFVLKLHCGCHMLRHEKPLEPRLPGDAVMRWTCELLLWLAFTAALEACTPAPAPTAAPAGSAVATQAQAPRASDPLPPSPPAVQLVDAGADGLSYGLVDGRCVEGRCAAIIQLRSATRLLDSVALEFAASGATLEREQGAGAGAGWTAGHDEGAVTTLIRPVRLGPGFTGLLVQQSGGFEHVKRRYDVFVHDGAKLRKIGSAAEGPGPAWSTAAVVSSADGAQDDIVYLEGFRPGGSSADRLSATRLTWDGARRALVQQPLVHLPALIAGEFASVGAARKAADAEPCLADYWVLPAERFGGKRGRLVLASVDAQQRGVDAELARACTKPVKRHAAAFQPDAAAFKE